MFLPQGWQMNLVGIDPARHWPTMRDLARRLDALPEWDALWVYDHFHTVPQPSEEATHEAWSLMSAHAAVTDRIRLGQMCTCMSYRHPAYLAKVAATVDAISGGRVNMGIGAGWYEHEWRAYGYGFPRAGERLGRLREGVEIFQQMWTTGSATLDGTHYQVDGARCSPRPLQGTSAPGSARNGIPIWMAGGGEKVTLRIAATYADATNFGGGDLEDFEHKSAVLERHCRDIGRDFTEIERSTNIEPVLLGVNAREVEERVRFVGEQFRQAGVPTELIERRLGQYRLSTGAGTPEQVAERLRALESAGATYAICYFPEAVHDTSGVELFERGVIPQLRSSTG